MSTCWFSSLITVWLPADFVCCSRHYIHLTCLTLYLEILCQCYGRNGLAWRYISSQMYAVFLSFWCFLLSAFLWFWLPNRHFRKWMDGCTAQCRLFLYALFILSIRRLSLSAFYLRVSVVLAMATWLAGWLAGWLSHSGIVSKWQNLSENFFDHLKAPSL